MPYVLDSTGLEIKTLDEIRASIKARLLANIDTGLDVSEESPLGEIVDTIADEVRQVAELVQEGFASQDAGSGSGFGLTQVSALTGAVRSGATFSQVLATVTLAAGTYPAGTLVAHPVGEPANRFANDATIVAPGGALAGQLFVAEEAGPVRALAGTLTVIAEVVSGFTSITNPLDATLGALAESDTALRTRRVTELYRRGSTSPDAIRADLLAVDGVTSVQVDFNDTDSTVGALTPHSLRAVVVGGTDADVALALWNAKAAGIATIGATAVSILDGQGNSQVVNIQRPTTLTVYLDITILGDATVWSNTTDLSTAVKAAIVEWADANLGVGKDVILYRLAKEVGVAVPGIIDAHTLEIGTAPSPSSTANLAVSSTQIADLDTSRITVTATLGAWP